MTDWTRALKGRQVSPSTLAGICKWGAYGKVLDVLMNQVTVRWADGRIETLYQSELELVPLRESKDTT